MKSSNNNPKPLLGSHTDGVTFGAEGVGFSRDSQNPSTINDFGDDKQLQFISQQSDGLYDYYPQSGLLLAGTGHELSQTLDGLDHSALPSQLDVDSEPVPWEGYPSVDKDFHKSLQDKIEEQLEDPQWPRNKPIKQFLPFDKLGDLVTRTTVEKELIHHDFKPARASELSAKIVGISSSETPRPGSHEKTTRRKLFAILVLINQVPVIEKMIDEGILDKDLPLIKLPRIGKQGNRQSMLGRKYLPRGGSNESIVPVRSVETWGRVETDYFYDNQWTMLAPFLQLSSPTAPKVHHYPLEYHTILPFVYHGGTDDVQDLMNEREGETGGFSEVHKVRIHEHHHSLFNPTAPEGEKNPFFAIKTLEEKTSKVAFEKEAGCLKRLMNKNSPSLVRLLGTFEYGNHYHLIFPWAEANLDQFMEEKYPEPDSPPRDASLARWIAREFASLASGLQLVHSPPIPEDDMQEMDLVSKKIYGRHGDIKPANILFFPLRNPDPEMSWDLGTLKIADFGFTAFHSIKSIEVPANEVGRTISHMAPECDGTANVSPSSDLWSLGAVMLELVVWYIFGRPGREDFEGRRLEDDYILSARVKQDKYFNIIPESGSQGAVVKESVRTEMHRLRAHERCSKFVHAVIDLIETKLLIVEPRDRITATKLADALNEINQQCRDSEDYCVSSVAEPRSSLGSDTTSTENSVALLSDTSSLHLATVTRETTFAADSGDEAQSAVNLPPQEPRQFTGAPCADSPVADPSTFVAEPAKSSGSRPGTRRSSTRACRQNSLKTENQSLNETQDQQASECSAPGANGTHRWTLRKRDTAGGVYVETAGTRKRKGSDENWLYPAEKKVARRSTH